MIWWRAETVSSYGMSHVQKRADNNRFVFATFQNICVYPFGIFASVADTLYVMCFVLCSSLINFFFALFFSVSFVCLCLISFFFWSVPFIPLKMPQMQPAFKCARHQNYEMPTINIPVYLVNTNKKTASRKMSWVEISIRFILFQLFTFLASVLCAASQRNRNTKSYIKCVMLWTFSNEFGSRLFRLNPHMKRKSLCE